MKDLVCPAMVAMKAGKTHFPSCHRIGCLEKKMLHQKHKSFGSLPYHWKIEFIGFFLRTSALKP